MGENCSKQGCAVSDVCGDGSELRNHLPFARIGGSSSSFQGHDNLHVLGEEPELTCKRFAMVRTFQPVAVAPCGASAAAVVAAAVASPGPAWSRLYEVGRELGSGQSAIAFEAVASSYGRAASAWEPLCSGPPGGAPAFGEESPSPWLPTTSGPPGSPLLEEEEPSPRLSLRPPVVGKRRTVAVKRFRTRGSIAFRQELKILLWTGVHPHVLRLLEAFQGEEDILVLEYCELGDMYEHYVRHGGSGMRECKVAELIRQLLLAIGYLGSRRVEHRDVKPENLLLFNGTDGSDVPVLKLADFGWATILAADGKPAPIPADGVGSLWYAPPELNPPVPDAPVQDAENAPLNSCDLWSAGVIAYLLLTGHSPFNLTLRIQDPLQRETEILRLAALGEINAASPRWRFLSKNAQEFCRALMRPAPTARLTVDQALAHPFVQAASRSAGCQACKDVLPSPSPVPAPIPSAERAATRRMAWLRLDGLQRLAWLAVATAISEPELLEGRVLQVSDCFVALQSACGAQSYVEELAVELVTMAAPVWFRRHNAVWDEVMRLAFRYLDVGMDDVLSSADLVTHVLGDNAEAVVRVWLERWSQEGQHLSIEDFGIALQQAVRLREASEGHGLGTSLSTEEELLHAQGFNIEDGCTRFLNEEPGSMFLGQTPDGGGDWDGGGGVAGGVGAGTPVSDAAERAL